MISLKPVQKSSGFSSILIIIPVVIVLAVAAFIYFQSQNTPTTPVQVTPTAPAQATQSPTMPSPTASSSSATPVPTTAVTSDLSVYKNAKYGFTVAYPKPYKVLDSKDDLSGYPKGVALLYTGGQSYDIVIEVWDTKAEYEANYEARVSDLKVVESKGKFITIFDNTGSPENQKIIESFKLL